jgi:hypothetical protein
MSRCEVDVCTLMELSVQKSGLSHKSLFAFLAFLKYPLHL